MPETILVCTAWPYANGSLHVGHLAGVYVPGDVFARFQRLRGNDVLMVSGSDAHGTPITVRAEQEGISPREVVERYHSEFLGYWRDLGISFDLYTHTMTDNHRQVSQDEFLDLREKGYLFTESVEALYDEQAGRFFRPIGTWMARVRIADTIALVATSARTAVGCWMPTSFSIRRVDSAVRLRSCAPPSTSFSICPG